MNKSRRGVALVMALVVVLVGGAIIAITFDIVFRYAWFSQGESVGFVDHTTMVDAIQAAKAYIVQTNINANTAMHAPSLGYDTGAAPPNGSLTLLDLQILDTASNSVISRDSGVTDGAGRHRLVVAVYDMYFDPAWLNQSELRSNPRDFPPVFNMLAGVSSGDLRSWGHTKTSGSGGHDEDESVDLDPDSYGAYLIRARLYDHRGVMVRMAEEAFVQLLPRAVPSP